ncbi:hypothetical protein [Bacillus kexueae]|uniref:hypothetical protein n=1 Tax=Aeribacillus kexueae TaxID=2078952 RepID=UPI001FAF878B|nr:hypothetical protein [Bacillus kexueae]
MHHEDTLLTSEEKEIVKRLKEEMLQALSVQHMRFYKDEMNRIYAQAKRRAEFMQTVEERSLVL